MKTESEGSPGFRRPLFFLMVAALLAADLLSKSWAFTAVGEGGGAQPVLGDWLSIYCVRNAGGIWGFGQTLTVPLTIIRMAAVGVLLLFVKRQTRENRIGVFVLGLLLAGALGNLYDNLSTWMPWAGDGHVRDFVMVRFGTPGWWPGFLPWLFDPFPIFNLADSCIFSGFVLLLTGAAQLTLKRPQPVQ